MDVNTAGDVDVDAASAGEEHFNAVLTGAVDIEVENDAVAPAALLINESFS